MYLIPLLIILFLVAVDQITKYLAVIHLAPIGSISVIKGVFSFTFVLNDGAAFGLFSGARWFFVIFALIVIGFLGNYYRQLGTSAVDRWTKASLILISAGALGNFVDRIRTGQVVDFLHATFINFPVFNVADIYVVIGAILLGVLMIFFIKEKEPESREENGGK